jgi:flavin-dependent dehydrogenase
MEAGALNAPGARQDLGMTRCDVFVIGGGPAGSTIAALLAQRGFDVVVAEKERHPRFHIGESLLPMNLPLFDRLGVHEAIARIGIVKRAAELNSPQHAAPVTLDFCEAWDKRFPYAYQVRRSEFDQILFERCVQLGATGLQDCSVTDVTFGEDGVRISTRHGDGNATQFRARFVVDASGRDTFLSSRLRLKRRNPHHASAALFGHFRNAVRLPGEAEGNISLYWFEHGWFWFIPLRDGTTSVGAVCWPHYLKTRKSDPTRFFLDTIALCPPLAGRLEQAQLTGPATATGNYSYLGRRMSGDRHILIGDAFAFVDPVFSSGVFLAMNSAFLGADVVEARLRGRPDAARLRRRFEREVRFGLRQFSWFIYRMTSPAMRKLFMAPRNYLRMQEALLSLLAGDLFRGTPIHWSLRAFKAVYYVTALLAVRDNLAAWWRRRRMMRSVMAEPIQPSSSG